MSDTDELSTELRELREHSAGLAVPAAPRLETITARGGRLRRRRRVAVATLSVAGLAAATALAVNLAGAPATTPSAVGTHRPGSSLPSAPAQIREAAFTITSNADGTVTLVMDPFELFEPAKLQDDLAQFGIPALVTTGKVCTSDPAPAGISAVESFTPGGPGEDGTITIDPSAMPAGSQLSFGTLDLKLDVRASYSSLIDPSDYSCTSDPLTDAVDHPAREGYISFGVSS